MRIIDSETHPINPAGLADCYALDVPWRFPYIPGALPSALPTAREAVAANHYEDHTADLLARMDEHGVDTALIMRGAWPANNADLARLVAEYPDRFVAFAGWDGAFPIGSPPRESAGALQALEEGLKTHGCKGVGEFELGRFVPLPPEQAYLGYVPTWEVCQKYAAPVLFHTGYDGSPVPIPYRNPIYLEPLATEFPEVPLLLAHMGRYDISFFEGALMLARKRRNVYLTTTNSRTEFIERAVEELGAERLIWGSDWSLQHGVLGARKGWDVHAHNLDAVRRARIEDREKELILGENLGNLLGI
jgi:uncharacterized protein